MVFSSSMVEMKLGESLFYPSFFSKKTAKLTLLTHYISIGKRATALSMGGLANGMSQHYSTQDQVPSLISAEAGFEIEMKKVEKSILFLFANGTTRCDLQLFIRPYGDCELITDYLKK